MSSTEAENHEFVPPPGGEFLGHPKALWNLFGAEFWERFCYYGMRAVLAPYVALQFFAHLDDVEAKAQASLTYGGYTSMVYMTGILGGYAADRVLGYQRSIMLGGALMAAGMFMLLAPDMTTFLLGLSLIVVGNGLFKPNISTMVGKLYAQGDIRRDSGFTIFYMGINAGAFLAPIICGTWIGKTYGYKWGFFAAGLGMIFGLMVFQILKGWLGRVGRPIASKPGAGPLVQVVVGAAILMVPVYFLLSESDALGILLSVMMLGLFGYFAYSGIQSGSREQAHRYYAMMLLFLANMCFWAMFEQAGTSMNFFAKEFVTPIFGTQADWEGGGFTAFQSANPVFILLLAPVFAAMWPRLDKMNINPSIPRKFAFGLLGVGAGFLVLVLAIQNMADGGKVHWILLTLCYLLHTMGELCLSPIGLSMVTKLARPHEVGLAMGGWFLSIATANFLAGRIAAAVGSGEGGDAATGVTAYQSTFDQMFWFGTIVAAIYFVFAKPINKLMHGIK